MLENTSTYNALHPNCQHCMLYCFCLQAANANKPQTLVHKKRQLKPKELLYSCRDKFSNIYAIKAGAVKTFGIDMEGKEHIHHFYLAGEMMGFEAVHAGCYPFSAISMSAETEVCEIRYEHLLEAIFSHPDLHRKILSFISQRFNFGLYVTAPHAVQRLASFLLELEQRLHAETSCSEFTLCMSRQDIGNYLGLATETVSRIFTRLQRDRIISVSNRKVKVLALEKLRWIAQG